jgi:hypothetical protein
MRIVMGMVMAAGLTAASGAQVAPPSEVLDVHDHVAAVSADRIEADITTLVSFGTRHTASETESETRGIGAARRWIHRRVRTHFGRLRRLPGGDVCLRNDQRRARIPEPTEVVSVLRHSARHAGSRPHGHDGGRYRQPCHRSVMDATSIRQPRAPMTTPRALRACWKRRACSPGRICRLDHVRRAAGEEQGLFGGRIVADYALEQGWRIKAVLNNDMIGNIAGIDGVVDNSTARIFSEGTRANETPEEARTRRFHGRRGGFALPQSRATSLTAPRISMCPISM